MVINRKVRLLVAAGGTGGHLFPALAVLEQISKLTNGEYEAEFVGNSNRIEGRVVPDLGYKLHNLPISGFGGILSLKTMLLPIKIMRSTAICRSIIKKFKPDGVICAGAYISYPAGNAAAKAGVPLFLMESNVIPGKTIRMLSSKAEVIFTAFEDSNEYFPHPLQNRLRFVGNPVRQDILNPVSKANSLKKFGLSPGKRTVLVFGGSLGARSINKAVQTTYAGMDSGKVQFLWQAGKNFEIPENLPENVKALTFIDDMAGAYSVADLVVARSGATTIAELCVTGKPSILVPFPNAANNHQEHNALLLQEKGASIMVADSEIEEVLPDLLNEYLFDTAELALIGSSAKELGKPNAAMETAMEILKWLL